VLAVAFCGRQRPRNRGEGQKEWTRFPAGRTRPGLAISPPTKKDTPRKITTSDTANDGKSLFHNKTPHKALTAPKTTPVTRPKNSGSRGTVVVEFSATFYLTRQYISAEMQPFQHAEHCV